MAVYVIASLTIKDTVRFEDYRRMLLPTMARAGDWLRAAAPLLSRESGRAKDSSSPSFPAWNRRESGGVRQNTPSQRRCAKPRLTRN
jgi:hypothetical protein